MHTVPTVTIVLSTQSKCTPACSARHSGSGLHVRAFSETGMPQDQRLDLSYPNGPWWSHDVNVFFTYVPVEVGIGVGTCVTGCIPVITLSMPVRGKP